MPEPNTSDSAVSTGDKNHPKIPWDCYFKVLGLHKTGGQGYQSVPFSLFEPNAVVMILEKIDAELFWDLGEMLLVPDSSDSGRTYQLLLISF